MGSYAQRKPDNRIHEQYDDACPLPRQCLLPHLPLVIATPFIRLALWQTSVRAAPEIITDVVLTTDLADIRGVVDQTNVTTACDCRDGTEQHQQERGRPVEYKTAVTASFSH